MKNLLLYFLIIFLTLACTANNSSDQRPNIILIIADDMNWDDSGAYGHPTIRTPNIDRLAQEGMRFTQAFLTTSSCSPSRTSILTGKYPHNTDAEQLHWPLPKGHITFVEQLKQSGYWTGLAGKYHLGDNVRDHFDKIMEVGTAGFQLGADGKQQKMEGDGSGCESWINLLKTKPKNKPGFLWLAAVDPHRPYQQNTIDKPHKLEDVVVPPYLPDNGEVRGDLALYYDEISRMDAYVGSVVEELDKLEISDNTFILFISDNGRPFPRDKTTLYEGGIKTPWIVKWPAKLTGNTLNHQLVSSIDIAPTFLRLAGVAIPEPFEGLDFSPLLFNSNSSIRDDIYAEDHWHDFEDYTRAIRTNNFKYIKNYYPDLPNTPPADAFRSPTYQSMLSLKESEELNKAQLRCFEVPRPQEELYDVVRDPFELENLAHHPDHRITLEQMRSRLEEMRSLTKDFLPSKRTADDFDRITGLPTEARIRPRPSKAEMTN